MLTAAQGPEIARRYGLGAAAVLSGPVAQGVQGRVWRLETTRGRFAVKEPFEPVVAEEAEADAAYQDAVRSAGVPMPAVVRTLAGAVVAPVSDTGIRVYEWVDVLPREARLDPATVGRLMAAIHRVVVPAAEPMHPWYVEPVGAGAWADLVDRLGRAGAPYADELAAVVPEISRLEASYAAVPGVQWCHLDLWADNLLRTTAGGLTVLDWENAGPGDPTQELGLVLFEFGLGDPGRTAALWRAYRAAGGPGRPREIADLTTLAAQTAHILQMACEGWLSATTAQDRDHHEAWAREFLDDPVTERRLSALLGSVRG